MTVQALLFKKNNWDIAGCKFYLNINKIKYLSYRTTEHYYRFRLKEPNYKKYYYRIQRNYNYNNSIDYIEQIPI